jgi:very-short-patch-repair endonuclease
LLPISGEDVPSPRGTEGVIDRDPTPQTALGRQKGFLASDVYSSYVHAMGLDLYEIAKQRNLFFDGEHLPYRKSLVPFSRVLRHNPTPEEEKLWIFLKRISVRVHRQRPIDNYIVDFYIAASRLVIEIDGVQHYTNEGKQYDDERTSVLESYGLMVLRISNRAIRARYHDVCAEIQGVVDARRS